MRLAPDQSVQYVVGAQSSFGYSHPSDSLGGTGAQWGYFSDGATGLLLCTHRFYDPSTGRWLTRDPISYRGGINLYGYVGNDPGNRVDPSGYLKDGLGDILTGLGAGAVAGGTLAGIAIVGGIALAPISAPVIITGIVVGVIAGAINEGQHGGSPGEIAEGGLLGGLGGGPGAVAGAACVLKFGPKLPLRESPPENGAGGAGDYGGSTGPPDVPLPPDGDPGLLPPEGWPSPEGPRPM